MKIIPAIDIIDGKCVRLTKGDYGTKKIYNENPLEVAKEFEDHGINYLHVVDLDGAKSQQIMNYKTLEQLAKNTNLHIDFGGGIKGDDDIRIAFESGAKQITAGSIAVTKPQLFAKWLKKYGQERIILGADANNRQIATNGWQNTSNIDVLDFIKQYEQKGVKQVICTDIAKDGMLQGPSFELYEEILKNSDIDLIASGGVSNLGDVINLKHIGCSGTIIGKAIYEGTIRLKDLEKECLQ